MADEEKKEGEAPAAESKEEKKARKAKEKADKKAAKAAAKAAKKGEAPAEGAEGGEKKEGEAPALNPDGTPVEAAPKGKKKLIIIILAVLLLGGGGAGVFMSGMLGGGGKKGDAKSEEEAALTKEQIMYHDMDEFLVNLNNPGTQVSFLKAVITLELPNQLSLNEVQEKMPKVRDIFQVYLRELRSSDLQGSAGLQRLRAELLLRVNSVMEKGKVNNILFKEIIIQ